MNRSTALLATGALAIGSLFGAACGDDDDTDADDVGQEIEDTGEDVGEGIEDGAEEVDQQIEEGAEEGDEGEG